MASARARRVGVPIAVVAAALSGGIVSYSMSVVSASSARPEVSGSGLTQGDPADCFGTDFSFDPNRYLQPQDRMKDDRLLPSTVSFRVPAVGLRPAGGDPCDDGGTSCLSDIDFDPENYWVVINETDDAPSLTVYVADVNTYPALTADDIPTDTGCDVTYEWVFSEVDMPFAGIIDYWNGDGASTSVTGETSTSMTISGLEFGNDWSSGSIYNLYVCGGNLSLRVTDGTNEYDIKAPPCSRYRFESINSSLGVGYKFEWKDPWNRDESFDQNPVWLGTGSGFIPFATIRTVKASTTVKITFHATGSYNLSVGTDPLNNCESATTPVLTGVAKTAGDVWEDLSPADERLYCLTEEFE